MPTGVGTARARGCSQDPNGKIQSRETLFISRKNNSAIAAAARTKPVQQPGIARIALDGKRGGFGRKHISA